MYLPTLPACHALVDVGCQSLGRSALPLHQVALVLLVLCLSVHLN
jgi:hypothetical protein